MVLTRTLFQSCGIWILFYSTYNKTVSKLRNMSTIVWYLQENCFKVTKYQYHSMVVKRKLLQSCGIWIPLYGSYDEIVSKLRNMITVVWQLKENYLKVAEHENNCMVVTRKLLQSCGIWIPLYGSYKEILSKLRNMNTILW